MQVTVWLFAWKSTHRTSFISIKSPSPSRQILTLTLTLSSKANISNKTIHFSCSKECQRSWTWSEELEVQHTSIVLTGCLEGVLWLKWLTQIWSTATNSHIKTPFVSALNSSKLFLDMLGRNRFWAGWRKFWSKGSETVVILRGLLETSCSLLYFIFCGDKSSNR